MPFVAYLRRKMRSLVAGRRSRSHPAPDDARTAVNLRYRLTAPAAVALTAFRFKGSAVEGIAFLLVIMAIIFAGVGYGLRRSRRRRPVAPDDWQASRDQSRREG